MKSLVELHHGRVSVTSPGKGRGSTFRVELPCSKAQAIAAPADVVPAGSMGLRVLVVEDNPDLRELTCDALASACRASTVTRSRAAHARAARSRDMHLTKPVTLKTLLRASRSR